MAEEECQVEEEAEQKKSKLKRPELQNVTEMFKKISKRNDYLEGEFKKFKKDGIQVQDLLTKIDNKLTSFDSQLVAQSQALSSHQTTTQALIAQSEKQLQSL